MFTLNVQGEPLALFRDNPFGFKFDLRFYFSYSQLWFELIAIITGIQRKLSSGSPCALNMEFAH